MIGRGDPQIILSNAEIGEIVQSALANTDLDNKRVLVLIPDGTRTMPMPLMFDLFEKYLTNRVSQLDYLVALGTHQPMTDDQLSHLVGRNVVQGKAGSSMIYNHQWDDPSTFAQIGTISAAEIHRISNGMMEEDVPVRLNKLILDYDHLIICGPVFPHEVVGFSGGNKYFFPGIAGSEIINFTHWLGAIITNYEIIGTGYTPVRAIIDKAASFIDRPVTCFCLVVSHSGTSGLFYDNAQEAWKAAAELSAKTHIVYVDQPYQKVISVMPSLYDDLWTAAKGMYKMEPVVADGGEVIIFAPHINEVSYTHGKILDEVGYHCRDFFLKQWDHYKHYPWGVLAHSTHLCGVGKFDRETKSETKRIKVTLATGIPEERCNILGLGYLNPSIINLNDWLNKEDEGILVVPRAGEMLYRLKNAKIINKLSERE
ncbi:MAG: lactate racemase domain-containing protein [Anaerolineaceae bacterium]|nr:lactate racemase domain-containing protein [Anaerolineaceae bacterium]